MRHLLDEASPWARSCDARWPALSDSFASMTRFLYLALVRDVHIRTGPSAQFLQYSLGPNNGSVWHKHIVLPRARLLHYELIYKVPVSFSRPFLFEELQP